MMDGHPEDGWRRAVERLEAAMNTLMSGDASAIKALYSHRDDVTAFFGWGGYEKGWAEVSRRWDWAAAQFQGGGPVRYEHLTAVTAPGLAVTTHVESTRVRLAGTDRPTEWSNRVTHVFRLEDGEWRLVHRHANRLERATSPVSGSPLILMRRLPRFGPSVDARPARLWQSAGDMARVFPVVFLPWLLWGFTSPESLAAGTVGPTDIVRVDDYIGAPSVLFGRTSAEAERTLGPPLQREAGAVPTYRNPAVFRPTQRLSYPGLVIDVLDRGRLRRVRIGAPGRGFPCGLDVGSPREEVERVLGEPQETADSHLMYLYSDGYPDTVHFHLRDGRVRGIEWNFGSAE
jgi:ketosteroid isomerase-like protein